MKRLKAHFSGQVQGVGFRYTVQRIVSRFPGVTGFVKNLSDGRVELLVEGDELDLQQFLNSIRKSSLDHYIRDVNAEWTEATGEFTLFEIRA